MPPTSVLCCGAEEVNQSAVLEAFGVRGEDVLCILDPPYLGRCDADGAPLDGATSGYLHTLSRPAVRRIAEAWSDLGAVVAIHECVSLDAELRGDWWATDISDTRIGQSRSFSTERGRTEWVTLNRPPVPRYQWPARDALPGQTSLFGGTP